MTLDYSKKKAALMNMTEHIDQMKEDFTEKLEIETKGQSDKFFSVERNCKRLCEEIRMHSILVK